MRLFSLLMAFALLVSLGCSAQRKSPYTIETTYDKLRTDYPFIKPIVPLEIASIAAAENITYHSADGADLKLDIYYPSATSASLHPAVLLVHGGGWLP